MRVYISGPITKGDRNHNLYQALQAQKVLMRNGFAVFNPMLSMLAPFNPELKHEQWLENDLPWVAVSDIVLRLPGESVGADMETEHAKTQGTPVVHSIKEVLDYAHQRSL